MRLLRLRDDGTLTLTPDLKSDDIPRYAILSHTWGPDDEELTFEDIRAGGGSSKAGHAKVVFCGTQARTDGLDHFWVDSCCINRSNSAELSEAIISMFAWYGRAEKCYVYLSDVAAGEDGGWETAFRETKWFTRGWTLQELLAPRVVEFYSREGRLLGDKHALGVTVQAVTGIPWSALQGADLAKFSVVERLQWAAGRRTTRVEDKAYCLLGVFNVFIPPMYGEGGNAFVRLEEEIWKRNRVSSAPIGSGADGSETASVAVLESLPTARQAAFDSASKQDDPLCLPDTRVEVMKRIRAWAYGEERSCIFWLNGMAGTGKSTISRTIAREFKERGSLGASFFFSRGDGDVAHAGLFFTTIAKQLAKLHPSMRRQLAHALDREPDLATKTRRDQWNKMIVEPLNAVPASAAPQVLIVVIDALDECNNDNDIKGIIKLLSEANTVVSLKLRILITSRPETPIRLGFKLMPQVLHQDLLLHDERREVVDADICLYLYDEFEKVKMMQDWLVEDWPGIGVVNQLVHLAGGLFIFAAIVCRFVLEDESRGADGSIQVFLPSSFDGASGSTDLDLEHSDNPTVALDRLYAQVLGKSFQKAGPLLEMLGTIANLCEPLSVIALARLLAVRPDDIHRQLNKLHSIIHVPTGVRDPIRLFHTSFRDFLLDDERCSTIYDDSGVEIRESLTIDSRRLHGKLALQCLRLLSESGQLRRDICSLKNPGARRTEIDGDTIDKAISVDVSYACRYWVSHLQRSDETIRDNGEVHRFLRDHWLYWIEALSWLGLLSKSLHQMTSLQWLAESNSVAKDFINDAKRFLMANRSIIDEAPLQLYCSALIFAPSQCLIRTTFQQDMMIHLEISPRVPETWGSELFKLEGHDARVHSVSVSADGQLIASGSGDNTVHIWDAASGELIQQLEGWNCSVNAMSFSPDSQMVAAGSENGDIWVWMTPTGDLVHRLQAGQSSTNCMTFSPDGNFIISGSRDGIVRVWGRDGHIKNQFKASTDHITALAVSPNEQYVATGAKDRKVTIWNLLTNDLIQPATLYSFRIYAMAFIPGGQLAVCGWHREDLILRASMGSQVKQFRGHSSVLNCVALSPDARQIAAGALDYSIRVWNTETGQQTNVFIGHEDRLRDVTFSPNGQSVVSASHDLTVRVWDASTSRPVPRSRSNDRVTGLRFSPDGRQVATIAEARPQLYDTRSGEQIARLKGSLVHPVALDFSIDSRLLAAISGDPNYETIPMWDTETGEQIWQLWGSGIEFSRIAFSPDGQLLAAASDTGTLQLWQVATCEQILFVIEPLQGLSSMMFSPDGGMIALRGEDHSVLVWNLLVAEVALSLELESHPNGCEHGMAFSSDGQMIAEASSQEVVVWIVATAEPMVVLRGQGGNYNSTAFSSDGDLVAAHSSEADTVEVWNIVTGERIRILEGFRLLDSMSFSLDASYLNTNIGQLQLKDDAHPPPIRLAGRWIHRKGEDVLWLPYEYHGYRSIYHNETLVLVQLCGELTFIRFKPTRDTHQVVGVITE